MSHACTEHGISERRACQLVNQPRGTQRYQPLQRDDEDSLTRAIIELASQYGRYGYRRITALLQRAGWHVGRDRVERIWRREGLKVPQKQKPRGRLWLNDGSCVRLRPEHANHVWSYDFVSTKTYDGRTARMLNLIDESTREWPARSFAPVRLCWRNAGESTTTRCGRTPRWAIGHRHHRRARPQSTRGMEKWKAQTASHFSTPPTATAIELQSKPLRYTNNRTGAKDRAGHCTVSVATIDHPLHASSIMRINSLRVTSP